ncbi:DUF4139 domain-containing protein [uncultured Flavobacterium sp.]|uniref:DUF4139 domain-containing protein n=1 Tax=uncultured Flavobacterium sp. TaxID=165435 RepID=UPI0025F689B7|nr:DUF4139 domain-containing protein [uncultured Flavobacterium sp.]
MKKIFLLCLLISGMAFAQKPAFTTAKAVAATVYFNGAELSHTASVNLPAGSSEIVVKNVADHLNESTVRIGAPSGLTVLSVQFTRDYISEYEPDETSPAIKKVRDSITLVQKDLERTTTAKAQELKVIELLDRNTQVGGQQSGLSVAELMKMADYYKAKRTETATAINALVEKEKKLNELLGKLNRRLETNTQTKENISNGKLVLQVMNEVAGNVPLTIDYLAQNAGWTVFYDLRADNTSQPINLVYKAQVVQQTGLDWKKVKLTLSSGMPNQNNTAPVMNPWFLQTYDPTAYASTGVANTYAAKEKRTDYSRDNNAEIVMRGPTSKSSISAEAIENQLNVSFNIDIPYDILSNGKKHSVTLNEIKLPASYRHLAIPKFDKEAYLLAEITDYSKYNLLKGEANIIFEGMYAGKTYIDPLQTTDTLSLSMGRDKKISIERVKVIEKSGSKFLSSKKEQTFTYDIIVRNNKKEAAQITVKDQYPVSTLENLEVELLESSGADINKETGILQWQMKLKPGETKKVRLGYRVRHPKNIAIGNL